MAESSQNSNQLFLIVQSTSRYKLIMKSVKPYVPIKSW